MAKPVSTQVDAVVLIHTIDFDHQFRPPMEPTALKLYLKWVVPHRGLVILQNKE